jgi:hypothetical protein
VDFLRDLREIGDELNGIEEESERVKKAGRN